MIFFVNKSEIAKFLINPVKKNHPQKLQLKLQMFRRILVRSDSNNWWIGLATALNGVTIVKKYAMWYQQRTLAVNSGVTERSSSKTIGDTTKSWRE